jgi:hypothetical protein
MNNLIAQIQMDVPKYNNQIHVNRESFSRNSIVSSKSNTKQSKNNDIKKMLSYK